MKRNKRRTLGLLLTLSLAVSLMCISVRAADLLQGGAERPESAADSAEPVAEAPEQFAGESDTETPEVGTPVKPGKVSSLTAAHQSDDATKITLTWKAAKNAASYQVERSADGGASWSVWSSTKKLTCADSTLTAGSTYRYRVSGVSADGTVGAAVQTKKVAVHLKKATTLKVKTASSTKLNLSWKAPAGAGYYYIYRADGKKIGAAAKTSYAVSGLSANTEYSFRVVAAVSKSDQTYLSASSAAASGKTGLKATGSLSCKAYKHTVKVSWKKVSGAKAYQVYRKTKKSAYQLIATTKSVKYTDKKVKDNGTYYYRIRAKGTYGKSVLRGDYSKVKKVKVLPLSGYVVCVDAGHGNNKSLGTVYLAPSSKKRVSGGSWGTSGVATGVSEATLTLKVAKRLRSSLQAQGAKVVMTRSSQVCNLNNIQRCNIASKAGANLTIRLHADGISDSSVKGVSMQLPGSTYCSSSIVKKSSSAGNAIYKAVLKSTGAKGRGQVKRNDLVGFNWSKNPTVLLEMGFMSNPSEDQKLQTASYQKKIVKGIVNGTLRYFK